MTLRAAMVLTTIADPVVLDGYCANFEAHGHLDQVQVIVIPDKKTPPEVFLRCAALRKKGLEVLCPMIEEQERVLSRLGFPPDLVPYNSDNRRNVGYLMAGNLGATTRVPAPRSLDTGPRRNHLAGRPGPRPVVQGEVDH